MHFPTGRMHRPALRTAIDLAGCLALTLVTLLVYRPFLSDFFALDDYIWLQAARNPDPFDFARRALSFPRATPVDVPTPFWRPLVDAYFFVAWRTYGLDPWPYHLTNVTIHAANACLVAALAWRLTHSRALGFTAGLIFAVLPTYDFAVVWISEVTELLGTFWYLSALTLYSVYLRAQRHRRAVYLLAIGAMILGLLTKESVATLAVAIAGLTIALAPPSPPAAPLRQAKDLLPFAGVTVVYLAFVYLQEYRASADVGMYRFDLHAIENLRDYLRWMMLPLDGPRARWPERIPDLLVALFFAAGITSVLMRMRVLSYLFLWTLVALLPYAFFPAGIEYRYTYLAAAPFTVFWVALIGAVAGRLPAGAHRYRTAALAMVVALAALGFGDAARDRQRWLSGQARSYQQLFVEAPIACGELAPGSEVEVLDSPVFDLFGESTRMALNLRYDGVVVHRRNDDPAIQPAATRGADCTLQYAGDAYRRLAGR